MDKKILIPETKTTRKRKKEKSEKSSKLVVEPAPVTSSLANSQAIDATGEAMDIENYMHPIARDSIRCNFL